MTGLKNPGNRQFLRQDDIAQLVDRLFFFVSLGIFQFFDAIENLSKIARRIDGEFVTDICLQFSRKLNPEYGRFAFQIEVAVFDEFSQRDDLLFLRGIDTANHRGDSLVLKFYDHRSLDVGSRRNHARRVVDFCFECSPVAQDILCAHENVCIEIDYFLTQLTIKPGHDGNHEDQHRYAQHHTENRDQCDDREKRALRFQVAQRQKKTKRQFQFGVSVAANGLEFNRARYSESACAFSSSSVTNSSAEACVASRSIGAARL